MAIDYSLYPLRFKYVLKLLELQDIIFDSKFFQSDISIESEIRELCSWLENNCIADQLWFEVVIKLVRKLKILIVFRLKKAFHQIQNQKKLLKKFKQNGKQLICMIRDIIRQMGYKIHMGNFSLWVVCNLQRGMQNMIGPYNDKMVESQLRLKQSEFKIYRLIQWMSIWNLKAVKQKVKGNGQERQDLMKQNQSINQEIKLVESKYWKAMNGFELDILVYNKNNFKDKTSQFIYFFKQCPNKSSSHSDTSYQKFYRQTSAQSAMTYIDNQQSPIFSKKSEPQLSSEDENQTEQLLINPSYPNLTSKSKIHQKINKKKDKLNQKSIREIYGPEISLPREKDAQLVSQKKDISNQIPKITQYQTADQKVNYMKKESLKEGDLKEGQMDPKQFFLKQSHS